MKLILIDNLDSFTFNLVESLERLGVAVAVRRNSIAAEAALGEAQAMGAMLMLSPGPGAPDQAGCCLELVARARAARQPLIGVCLGHQAIAEEAGGTVGRTPEPVHGKADWVSHDGAGPFVGLPTPLRLARYHSLGVSGLPERFTVHAASADGVPMAFTDPVARQAAVQFHPESILTTHGDAILRNLLNM